MAHYYNCARDWNKEVVVNTKFGFGDNIQVFDIERGKSDVIRRFPWQTDTSVGTKSWSFCNDEINKTPNHIIDDFIDIVSKNGNLLLNVGPRADGSITDEQANILKSIGGWLKINGEAIFKSRPWVLPSEGLSKGTSGYMTDNEATNYKATDIRFTVRDNNLYAISLEWTDGSIVIKSFAACNGKSLKVKSVSMLGSNEKIEWKQTKEGLFVKFPKNKPTDYAHVFKIELSGVALGKLEKENGSTYSLRVFNHSSVSHSVKLSCTVDSKSEIQKATIPAQSLKVVEFYMSTANNSKSIPVLTVCK
jgi:alpha-L-fucosidase